MNIPKRSYHSPYELAFATVLGPEISDFSFWKGRVALFTVLKALGVSLGDEVLVPGFTCVVVPNAVRFIVGYFGSHGVSNALDMLLEAAALLDQVSFGIVLVGLGSEKTPLPTWAAVFRSGRMIRQTLQKLFASSPGCLRQTGWRWVKKGSAMFWRTTTIKF